MEVEREGDGGETVSEDGWRSGGREVDGRL